MELDRNRFASPSLGQHNVGRLKNEVCFGYPRCLHKVVQIKDSVVFVAEEQRGSMPRLMAAGTCQAENEVFTVRSPCSLDDAESILAIPRRIIQSAQHLILARVTLNPALIIFVPGPLSHRQNHYPPSILSL